MFPEQTMLIRNNKQRDMDEANFDTDDEGPEDDEDDLTAILYESELD
jgi:hypothetical protein